MVVLVAWAELVLEGVLVAGFVYLPAEGCISGSACRYLLLSVGPGLGS